ncbi:PaREP1 family protein [Pyrobaculum sp. 3827-6]|uniref:PaREP1 family protein n=1 Tax=Pyrobaculum sp. 3827-6 TaxID=2983604 RepID=UPI0021D9E169|nr:PaREP1 family protein [Pyrobaculum sp. 3827-6]MCU7787816.1 PaREP1 family protein [Pyrobaculum sp. 3827-6]
MYVDVEVLERPLPKPSAEDYVKARLLEALVEAGLALEYLRRGLVRNAAGKAFQAWKALMAALLRLELDSLKGVAKSDEERRWLETTAVPRVPTNRMKALSHLLVGVGYKDFSAWTSVALSLHEYQYHGPDPDMAWSKYRTRDEAARDVVLLLRELGERVEAIKDRVRWSPELEKTLQTLRKEVA